MPSNTNEKSILRFRTLAIAWLNAVENAKHKVANRNFDEMLSIARVLTASGQVGELRKLLEDKHPAVRFAAANSFLGREPDRALPVLEDLSDGPKGALRLAAYTALLIWRSGPGKVH